MAFTVEQICNMALGHIGVSQQIQNISKERSNEAGQCRLFYQPALESTLEDFPWPEATAYRALALVTDYSALATPHDWLYAYRYPTDCVFVRRFVTVLGRREPTPPPYHLGQDDQGKLILTDDINGVIEYTKRIDDPAQFSALFADALSWRLGALLAPGMSRIKDMAVAAEGMFGRVLAKAQVKSGNEGQQGEELESEFIRARQ